MKWISVKDRMPEEDAKYLVYAPSLDKKKPFIHIAWCDPSEEWAWGLLPKSWSDAVTHWMPLPEPPE